MGASVCVGFEESCCSKRSLNTFKDVFNNFKQIQFFRDQIEEESTETSSNSSSRHMDLQNNQYDNQVNLQLENEINQGIEQQKAQTNVQNQNLKYQVFNIIHDPDFKPIPFQIPCEKDRLFLDNVAFLEGQLLQSYWNLYEEKDNSVLFTPSDITGAKYLIDLKLPQELYEITREFIVDRDKYKEWNSGVLSFQNYQEELINDWKIQVILVAGKFPVQDRIFVERAKYGYIGDVFYFIMTSAGCESLELPDVEMLKGKNIVRGHTNLSAFKLFKAKGQLHLINYMDADAKGWIPKFTYTTVGIHRARQYIQEIQDGIQRRLSRSLKSKNQELPSSQSKTKI